MCYDNVVESSWFYPDLLIGMDNTCLVLGEIERNIYTLHLTKLIVNDVEVEIILNSNGNVEVPIEEGKIYLIKSYFL